jgi:adenine-specific DNA-methyltransferase
VKFIDEVSAEKLRGGFYTPAPLVVDCYRRIAELLPGDNALRLLEPSAGDGAFIRYRNTGRLTNRFAESHTTCIELNASEAGKCSEALQSASAQGRVINADFFRWAQAATDEFDAVVGNPPFVRYQFIPKRVRAVADSLISAAGNQLAGVSNLWIPFTLISLDRLKYGGAFALVLPSEILATKSTGLVRSELIRHFAKLHVDLYPRGHFPDILQDVVVVSGVRDLQPCAFRTVIFHEHLASGINEWSHVVDDGKDAWTHYLLTQTESDALKATQQLPGMHKLGSVASISVAIVTGANDFFTVSDEIVNKYKLHNWTVPLLARTVDSPGIVFRRSDHTKLIRSDRKRWLLDFSADKPDPEKFQLPECYLKLGEGLSLPGRYKCRIRKPWYRVPDIRSGDIMLSKRSHRHHRLILNSADVVTTDTIYRGAMRPQFKNAKSSLIAGFHNSLTILTSELEGRSYGGGVLELVPSEIARLMVPMVDMKTHLTELDKIGREAGGQLDTEDKLIEATDAKLAKLIPGLKRHLPVLWSARERLRNRRFFG